MMFRCFWDGGWNGRENCGQLFYKSQHHNQYSLWFTTNVNKIVGVLVPISKDIFLYTFSPKYLGSILQCVEPISLNVKAFQREHWIQIPSSAIWELELDGYWILVLIISEISYNLLIEQHNRGKLDVQDTSRNTTKKMPSCLEPPICGPSKDRLSRLADWADWRSLY